MSKKIISSATMIIILFNLLTAILYVKPVLANETILIKDDGSIYPQTANITSADNITYYFTDDNYHEIIVQKSDIVVDGAGYSLQGSEVGYGFYLYNVNNVTILNTNIENFSVGICLNSSSCNNISFNHIINNDKGIWLRYSSNSNAISENNIANREHGIQLFYNSSNNEIARNDINSHLDDGIQLFEDCSYNVMFENNIKDNNDGIELWRSSDYNDISRNHIAGNNDESVWVYQSSYNTITGNNITNNKQGIELEYSSFNSIYHNNFVENTQQANNRYSGYANTWDNGYPSGGNYWSDYLERYPYALEIGDSGIWDTPYNLDEDNQDNYPLVEPWIPTSPTINATINIIPNMLNLRNKKSHIKAFIEFQDGYNVSDIDVTTIFLNDTIPIDLNVSIVIGDYDNDSIPDLMLKFSRAEVIDYILDHINMTKLAEVKRMEITLTISSELIDGARFESSDIIWVMMPKGKGGFPYMRSFIK